MSEKKSKFGAMLGRQRTDWERAARVNATGVVSQRVNQEREILNQHPRVKGYISRAIEWPARQRMQKTEENKPNR